jgi:hypothetical protein
MADLVFEEWKDVVGHEGLYMISNLGRVKSLRRVVSRSTSDMVISERILSQNISTTGYYYVVLHKDKKPKTCKIHRLVGLSFIPNPHNKPQINHIDGNKLNNTLNNLEWVSVSENAKHSYGMGLSRVSDYQKKMTSLANRGQNCANSKLTEYDIQVIRDAWATGVFTQKFLSQCFFVGQDQISRIINHKRWAWL